MSGPPPRLSGPASTPDTTLRPRKPLCAALPKVPPVQQTPSFADDDLDRLQTLLEAVPAPLQALDVSALDGFLCGVLLQPQTVPPSRWLALVTDVEGRADPAAPRNAELQALVMRRHAELDAAIGARQWFDPWMFQTAEGPDGDDASPVDGVLPWTAGFALAMEHFPALMELDDPELIEPLALLFMHFDPQDLEDADELIAVIETLEPPKDMAEAVQDVVRALMLIADVSRPRQQPPTPRRPTARRGPARGATRTTARSAPRSTARRPR